MSWFASGGPTMLPMLPGSVVPRAKIRVVGAQTPFWTSLAVMPMVLEVVCLRMPWGVVIGSAEEEKEVYWKLTCCCRNSGEGN